MSDETVSADALTDALRQAEADQARLAEVLVGLREGDRADEQTSGCRFPFDPDLDREDVPTEPCPNERAEQNREGGRPPAYCHQTVGGVEHTHVTADAVRRKIKRHRGERTAEELRIPVGPSFGEATGEPVADALRDLRQMLEGTGQHLVENRLAQDDLAESLRTFPTAAVERVEREIQMLHVDAQLQVARERGATLRAEQGQAEADAARERAERIAAEATTEAAEAREAAARARAERVMHVEAAEQDRDEQVAAARDREEAAVSAQAAAEAAQAASEAARSQAEQAAAQDRQLREDAERRATAADTAAAEADRRRAEAEAREQETNQARMRAEERLVAAEAREQEASQARTRAEDARAAAVDARDAAVQQREQALSDLDAATSRADRAEGRVEELVAELEASVGRAAQEAERAVAETRRADRAEGRVEELQLEVARLRDEILTAISRQDTSG